MGKRWIVMNDHEESDFQSPEWVGVEVLCDFCLAGNRCWVVVASTAETLLDSDSFVAIRCFDVAGRTLAIIQQAMQEQQKDGLSRLLTARELQIATLVAMGCPNKQVADKLHISEWTVATYLRRIFAKLGVESRAAMTFRCASLICKHNGQAEEDCAFTAGSPTQRQLLRGGSNHVTTRHREP